MSIGGENRIRRGRWFLGTLGGLSDGDDDESGVEGDACGVQ